VPYDFITPNPYVQKYIEALKPLNEEELYNKSIQYEPIVSNEAP
jgi:hypothetical protein